MGTSRYYTPGEVALHNVPSDCWVSYLGKVYDLTLLCKEHMGDVLLKPIIANAGRDISHWFNSEDGEVSDVLLLCYTPECMCVCVCMYVCVCSLMFKGVTISNL